MTTNMPWLPPNGATYATEAGHRGGLVSIALKDGSADVESVS